MTPDFDLAVYVKGDRKSTAVYNAYLEIEYEGEGVPVCGMPTYDTATENAVFVWNDCSDEQQWHMVISGGGTRTIWYDGEIASDNGFDSLTGFSLESTDIVDPEPPVTTPFSGPITYSLVLRSIYSDGLNFRVTAQEDGSWDGCFGATTPYLPVYVGANRVELTAPFSLATFGACTP